VLALIKKVEGKHRNDYALLVSALSKAKDLSDKERMSAAQTLYERMNKLHDNHSARLFDVAIFSTLIKIFAAGGDWARCEALMQHMHDEKIKPTIVTYTNLLKYCERVESWHKAAEVLEQMKTEAPGLKPDVVFYTAMVNVCCKR
jgi:pentatricopeptide repeat protein